MMSQPPHPKTVNLSIEASDADSLDSMQFANSSKGPWSALEAYSSKKSGWTLSSGPGTKTVYAKIFDSAGNYTIKSDTIKLIPDITQISPNPASGLSSSASNTITITGTSFGSSRSSSSYIMFPNGIKVSSRDRSKVPTWSDTIIKVKVPSSAVTGDVVVVNSAGTSAPYALVIDSIAPTVSSLTINSNEPTTTSKTVNLSIDASDSGQALQACSLQTAQKGPSQHLKATALQSQAGHFQAGPAQKLYM